MIIIVACSFCRVYTSMVTLTMSITHATPTTANQDPGTAELVDSLHDIYTQRSLHLIHDNIYTEHLFGIQISTSIKIEMCSR